MSSREDIVCCVAQKSFKVGRTFSAGFKLDDGGRLLGEGGDEPFFPLLNAFTLLRSRENGKKN